MRDEARAAEQRYAALVEEMRTRPGVTHGAEPGSRGRFGSNGLKAGGKLFAMLSHGSLVLKLPRHRVDALVASGDGVRFDPRRDGRLMKEWLVLVPDSDQDWAALATEAMAFVSSRA